MIFQDPMTSLNPTLTIGKQITETLERHRGMSRQGGAEARDRAPRGGPHPEGRQFDDYPHRYSGGMRQRVMIAIAISATRSS